METGGGDGDGRQWKAINADDGRRAAGNDDDNGNRIEGCSHRVKRTYEFNTRTELRAMGDGRRRVRISISNFKMKEQSEFSNFKIRLCHRVSR